MWWRRTGAVSQFRASRGAALRLASRTAPPLGLLMGARIETNCTPCSKIGQQERRARLEVGWKASRACSVATRFVPSVADPIAKCNGRIVANALGIRRQLRYGRAAAVHPEDVRRAADLNTRAGVDILLALRCVPGDTAPTPGAATRRATVVDSIDRAAVVVT